MIYRRLIDMLRHDTEHIAEKFCEGVRKCQHLTTYQKMTDERLIFINSKIYTNLANWLEKDTSNEDVEAYLLELGHERFLMEFPLGEVYYGLYLSKKTLWRHLLAESFLDDSLRIYQALELMAKLHNFFDFATFFIIRGYHNAMLKEMQQKGDVSPEVVAKYFHELRAFKDADISSKEFE